MARPALKERMPLGRDTGMSACVRIGVPTQRCPAVVRRPGPRRTEESSEGPLCASASPPLCVEGRVEICVNLRYLRLY